MFKTFFSLDFTFSKRLLGTVLVVGGVLGIAALLGYDLIRDTDEIGPAQRAAMVVLGAAALVGLTLIPLGRAEA
ncbi:MAG: hypothetical protein MUF38_18665 [Anaerolineae bacterium]|nr:hypothetical protein [Anaerolineae bacterium]